MGEVGVRDELDEAWDEHERLTLALATARARQEALLTSFLDGLGPRVGDVAGDLSFGFEGVRARGIVLARGSASSPLFLIAGEESWVLIERHAHGVHAVVDRVSAGALLDAFGRGAIGIVDGALQAAQEAAAVRDAEAARATAAAVVERARAARP
ncbi:MAG TPA: hypothetical protein VLT33_34415, partial [Labilithrix sp.]|nr:hypothetical protein [Labilithrix sp.]